MKKYFFYILLVFAGAFITGQSVSATVLNKLSGAQKTTIATINKEMQKLLLYNNDNDNKKTVKNIKNLLQNKELEKKSADVKKCLKNFAKKAVSYTGTGVKYATIAVIIGGILYFKYLANSQGGVTSANIQPPMVNQTDFNQTDFNQTGIMPYSDNFSYYNPTDNIPAQYQSQQKIQEVINLDTYDTVNEDNLVCYEDNQVCENDDDPFRFYARQKNTCSYKIKQCFFNISKYFKKDKEVGNEAKHQPVIDQRNTTLVGIEIEQNMQKILSGNCQDKFEQTINKLPWYYKLLAYLPNSAASKAKANCVLGILAK